MNNTNYFLSRGKKFNQKLKELFQKKLKDRYKIRGYSFSNSKNISLLGKKQRHNLLTHQEQLKKIKKENELKFAMENYLELKHNIYSLDKKQKTKIVPTKNFKNEKINFSNLKEILNEFIRDKNKHSDNRISITKSKLKLDNVNRGIKVNRINDILSKISLHFNKAKNKVDVGRNDRENHENNYKKLIEILNESRKKFEQRTITSRRKVLSLDKKRIKNNYNLDLKINLDNKKDNYTIDNRINTLDNRYEYMKTLYTNINTNDNLNSKNNIDSNDDDEDASFIRNKSILNKFKYNGINNNYKSKKRNIKQNERPLSYSRNVNLMNDNYNTIDSSLNNAKNVKRLIKTDIKKKPFKVKNLPLYTTKIEDILNEYDRIKNKSKLTEIHYKEAHLATFKEIDNIVKIKEDLLIFLLREKFLKNKYPLRITKTPNKRKIFIKKFKDNVDSIDRKYFGNFISI